MLGHIDIGYPLAILLILGIYIYASGFLLSKDIGGWIWEKYAIQLKQF